MAFTDIWYNDDVPVVQVS